MNARKLRTAWTVAANWPTATWARPGSDIAALAAAISYPVRMQPRGPPMTRFLARRLLNYVVLLALASFLAFSLASLAVRTAGQPAAAQPAAAAGRDRRQGRRARPRQADPGPVRKWASGAVRGDFGTTVAGQPVSDELWRRIGVSLRLLVIGSVMGTVIGVVVGAWGAIRQYRLSATGSSRCCRCW